MELPKAFKKKWIAALRSGKFKQTDNNLKKAINWDKDDNVKTYGYCCLGVACAISGYDKIRSGTSYIGYEKKKVPLLLRGEKDLTKNLANMNDRGYSFKRIANWIEKNL